ncbi:MAG TPA: DNA alkylation repair protein [Candidatus Saccharimonas sp.]|nr:DNA alkylation repair protein [Candidatus Saccharimonas sp.]
MTANDVLKALKAAANADDAIFLQRFFKTGKGQYGEGDVFIGARMPALRIVCKKYTDLPHAEIQKLFDSDIHECRMAAAVILAYQYPKTDLPGKKAIFDLYVKNVLAGRVNNWDIVDVTAENVIGRHLYEQNLPRDILFKLARSGNIWQRRVGIMSSFYFFKNGDGDYKTTLELCEILLHDTHNLIQKVVGWMLREIGKRVDRKILLKFLDEHAATMPRTTLRYAIEHLPPEQKQFYMRQKSERNRN